MAPVEQNEPWLSSAIELLENLVEDCLKAGIKREHIHLLGFSQGACLTLEFAARTASRYGSVTAFTGGLIGEKIAEMGAQVTEKIYPGMGHTINEDEINIVNQLLRGSGEDN